MTEDQEPKPAGTTPPEPPSESSPEQKPDIEAPKTEDVVAVPTPAAYTQDVVNVGGTKKPTPAGEEDDDEAEEEPAGASRLSPHAVAAFAVSLMALFQAPQNVFQAQGLQSAQFLRYVLPTFAVPVGAALASLWLAFRADEEIFMSDGKLGGIGYYRAARVVSILVLAIAIAAFVTIMFFTEAPQQTPQFG